MLPESQNSDDPVYIDEVRLELANGLTRPLEIMRVNHSTSVSSVVFSPDGRRVVSGSDDRTLRMWDTGMFTASLQELVEKAEQLCPLSLEERRRLRLIDPKAEAKQKPLTPDQRRACGE